jgi:hypothetical protein
MGAELASERVQVKETEEHLGWALSVSAPDKVFVTDWTRRMFHGCISCA